MTIPATGNHSMKKNQSDGGEFWIIINLKWGERLLQSFIEMVRSFSRPGRRLIIRSGRMALTPEAGSNMAAHALYIQMAWAMSAPFRIQNYIDPAIAASQMRPLFLCGLKSFAMMCDTIVKMPHIAKNRASICLTILSVFPGQKINKCKCKIWTRHDLIKRITEITMICVKVYIKKPQSPKYYFFTLLV